MLSNPNSRLISVLFTGSLLLAACSTVGTPSPPSPTQPPPAEEPATSMESDVCLQGTWVMPTVDLDLMISTLLPMPGVRVPAGELLMIFDGSDYSYLSYGYILHMDLGADSYMESTASFTNTGSFSTGNGVVVFSSIVSESEVSAWTGYKNGETYTVPGSSPQVSTYPLGENPYRCTNDRLEIDTYHPTIDTLTLFFSRLS
jgi:hypothetical protein